MRGHRFDIEELDAVGSSLKTFGEQAQETKGALLDMAVRHEQIAAELMVARRDALTGLPGRAMLLERMEELRKAVGRIGGHKLALMFVDLDGFKAVNDTFGHDKGDEVLIRTAEILKTLTRDTDIAGRLGGDEFMVCISAPLDLIGTTARSVAKRLVEEVGAIGMGIGCSVGIAIWPDNCPDVSCVMKQADDAMYEAKRRGKNQYAIFGRDARADGTEWPALRSRECTTMCWL